jgi:Ricin-type beta-trefoil lectin domain
MFTLLRFRRLSAVAVTAAAIAAIGIPASAAPVYTNITNYHHSFCIDAAGGSNWNTNGDPVQLWGCNTNNEQLWYYDRATQQIINQGGKCLDASSTGFPYNGDLLQLWSCNTNAEQQWGITYYEDNYQIFNVAHHTFCVDVDSAGFPANGGSMWLWGCDNPPKPEQLWFIIGF